jgi:anti-sigma B factor antagonist
MDFKTIKVDFEPDRAIVAILEKRIYLGITDLFREDMISVLDKEFNELIINLEHVAVMNSAGLGVLIMAQDTIKKRGGTIKLINLQPLMLDIFSRMRLDTLFEIFDTIDEALAHN